MALLQISEPGLSAAPHQHRLVVGIDLGTTHSLVATVRSGISEVLPDTSGRALLPSVVHYTADGGGGCWLGSTRWREQRSAQHHRFGQALYGSRYCRHCQY